MSDRLERPKAKRRPGPPADIEEGTIVYIRARFVGIAERPEWFNGDHCVQPIDATGEPSDRDSARWTFVDRSKILTASEVQASVLRKLDEETKR